MDAFLLGFFTFKEFKKTDMSKKYIQCFIFIIFSELGYSKNAVLCPTIIDIIGIEDLNDVPLYKNDNFKSLKFLKR